MSRHSSLQTLSKGDDRSEMDAFKNSMSEVFKKAAETLIKDPLMECFRSSSESQAFMMDRVEEVVLEAVRLAATDEQYEAHKTISELRRLLRSEPGSSTMQKDRDFGSHPSVADQLSSAKQQIERLMNVSRFTVEDTCKSPSILAEKLSTLEARCVVLQAERHKAVQDVIEYREEFDHSFKIKQDLEKAIKKAEWELNERQETHERQISKLTEEIGFLRAKQKVSKDQGDSKQVSILRSTLATLETRFKEVKEKYSSQKRELEESNFECQTLKATVDRLKTECQDSSDRELAERKNRHSLEMTLIELKKKISESSAAFNETDDALKQAMGEMLILQSEMNQLNENLKAERRKSLNLDRELEQAKFVGQRKDKEFTDTICRHEEQYRELNSVHEQLSNKYDALIRDSQSMHARESKNSTKIASRIKELEIRENEFQLIIEDLQKKLAFYKEKAIKKDYESVSKNSILEKLANLLRTLSIIKEGWLTEKFIIKQEMSCISSLVIRSSDIYYSQLKRITWNKHKVSNLPSRSIPSISNDNACQAVLTHADKQSPQLIYSLTENNKTYGNGVRCIDTDIDEQTKTDKLESVNHSTSTASTLNRLLSSSHRNASDRNIDDMRSMINRSKNVVYTDGSDNIKAYTACRGNDNDKTDLLSCTGITNQRTSFKMIDSNDFMARVNARVQAKLRQLPSQSIELTSKIQTYTICDKENMSCINKVPTLYSHESSDSLLYRLSAAQKDTPKHSRIEKESEEIAKRIQMLKLREIGRFN